MDKKVYCSKCEQKQHYFVKQEELTRKVKDNTYTLDVKVAHCAVCDEEVYIPEISDQTQQSFFNAYRVDHQLLTVDELISIRKNLGLNQRDFSRLLGFGEITISRYELGSLPSKNNSQTIKKISDKKNLEEKYEQNKSLMSEDGRKMIEERLKLKENVTGKVKYSQDKFYELTYLFVKEAKKNGENMTETKLNKLLFYADFNHYKKLGKGITGSKYLKFQFGPVPNRSQLKYSANPYISFFKTDEDKTQIDIISNPIKWHLTEFEKKIVEVVYSYFKNSNASVISDISHQENAWTKTELFEEISYEHAKDLRITV
jgi:putative zinc finger/helix-turn-helix YgiT family protein